MFCQTCGTQVQMEQSHCRACGKLLFGNGGEQPSRLERHVRLLGIFWIAYSAFSLIAGIAVAVGANVLLRPAAGVESGAPEFLYPLLSAVGILLLIKAVAGISAGYGLIHREKWARTLALVLGFIDLLHAPLGTILGIYTTVVLLAPGAGREYRVLPQTA